MTFPLLAVAVAFGVFAAVAWAVSFVTWAAGRMLPEVPARPADSAIHARRCFVLRVLPGVSGGLAAALALGSFLLFEPRGLVERPGATFLLLSILGAAWAAGGGLLAARELIRARTLARDWTRSGRALHLAGAPAPVHAIRHPFPLVSLVGVLRARIFVAEKVLESLSAAELQAVLSHEARHLAARDNLKRVAIRLSPALPWPSAARSLEKRWEQSCEEACDGQAADALEMASALVKTARLARAAGRVDVPAVAVHRGGSLARRVRLLTPGAGTGSAAAPAGSPWRRRFARGFARALVAAGVIGLVLVCTARPDGIHQLVETFVHLP